MSADEKLVWGLVIWGVALVLLIIPTTRRRSATCGLVIAYVVSFWLIHWLSSLLYAIGSLRNGSIEFVAEGFLLSAFGILAFVIGSIGTRIYLQRFNRQVTPEARHWVQPNTTMYLSIGILSYILASSPLAKIPSATALLASGQQFFVIGLCLNSWVSWRTNRPVRCLAWMSVSLLLPLFTMVTSGFMSFGAAAAFVVLSFVAVFLRPRWLVATGALALGFLMISVFVSYMRDRTEIRKVVWGGESLSNRVDRVTLTLETLEWFDPRDPLHLAVIDGRLNQNYLDGLAAINVSRSKEYAHGETLVDALLSMIPRAVWPEKRIVAGGSALVTRFTGLEFPNGTSVGPGPVLELYVNFGTAGVLIGFLIIGSAVTWADVRAHGYLLGGDWRHFILWYGPAMSLLQVGGSFVEITGSGASCILLVLVMNKLLLPRDRRKNTRAATALPRTNAPQASWR